jgi:prolyl oligopeptidase
MVHKQEPSVLQSARCFAAVLLVACAGLAHGAPLVPPPSTERHDVPEMFFGQTVVDRYRWLEEWHDAKVEHWLKDQDHYARDARTRIPGRGKFLARVPALDTASTKVKSGQVWGGKTFYLKADPGADNFKR